MKLNINFKKSIAKKLFVITSITFVLFIFGTLFIQTVFFEKFYTSKKKSDLVNALKRFKSSYVLLNNNQDIANLIGEYEDNHTYKIFILDDKVGLKYIVSPNERSEANKAKNLRDLVFQIRNRNILPELMRTSDIKTFVMEGPDMGVRGVICGCYILDRNEFVFFTDSLQPVNEAALVVKELYIYFFIGAFILVIALSFLYSNMITKPLREVNLTATKMAKLNFEEKCIVKSEDEIGNLALSLNILSENLKEALDSLKNANIKLQQDIDKEKILERMRKEFVAAVSHELKTPINLIEGYTEGLKDDIFEDKNREFYLDVILDESKKMSNLVNDMLDLSQLESGNFNLNKEEFFIDKLIEVVIKKFSKVVLEKNINLKTELTKDISIYADWDRIEQVIVNYITNAIRHTGEKGNIEIKMKDNEDLVTVQVFNTGSHIPEEELENIWDKFYKIDKSRNRELGGTGIGLAIVKNIILLHQGFYGVENTKDGVMFYFVLKKHL